jgi:two-component system sensor histidine kinase KdpD
MAAPRHSGCSQGLPQVPLRKIAFRGVELLELDVDEVKRRAPEIVLVDEVAHTNAPGSVAPKRYEDIVDLLQAGIHVYSAFNIQHWKA